MNKKVLLVADDVEMNRNVIRRFLKNDFEVLEAADGKETMEILESKHVDLLLLDIIMPEKNGLEVLEEVRGSETYPTLGILVATSTKEKTERKALSLGADDIVAKPYDPIVIKKRLENILTIRSMQMQKNMGENNTSQWIKKEEIENSLEILRKIADVIEVSKESPEMIIEMVKELRKESEKISKALVDKETD